MRRYRRSMRRRRRSRGATGDCGVDVTLQMCNRVTNYGDMSTFYKPVSKLINYRRQIKYCCEQACQIIIGTAFTGVMSVAVTSLL